MRRGQALMEYALILALVAGVCVVALHVVGWRVWSAFECTAQAISHPIHDHCGRGGRL